MLQKKPYISLDEISSQLALLQLACHIPKEMNSVFFCFQFHEYTFNRVHVKTVPKFILCHLNVKYVSTYM